jgi:hypothetical protein
MNDSLRFSFFDKLTGGESNSNSDSSSSALDDFNKTCTLSYKTRLMGCAACFVLGYIIMFMSLLTVSQLGRKPEKFAILYTLGNIIALMSTCFLWGPVAQVKNMFKPIRIIATVVYLVCIALTIFFAFKVQKTVPILLMIIAQFFAGFWYNISYIPFARSAVKKCLAGICT